MTNPFQFYPQKWVENSDSPIAYVFFIEELQQFMDDQGYDPLSDEELGDLLTAFMETAKEEFMDEVLCTLRPNHRN
jgi:hypothetical protein